MALLVAFIFQNLPMVRARGCGASVLPNAVWRRGCVGLGRHPKPYGFHVFHDDIPRHVVAVFHRHMYALAMGALQVCYDITIVCDARAIGAAVVSARAGGAMLLNVVVLCGEGARLRSSWARALIPLVHVPGVVRHDPVARSAPDGVRRDSVLVRALRGLLRGRSSRVWCVCCRMLGLNPIPSAVMWFAFVLVMTNLVAGKAVAHLKGLVERFSCACVIQRQCASRLVRLFHHRAWQISLQRCCCSSLFCFAGACGARGALRVGCRVERTLCSFMINKISGSESALLSGVQSLSFLDYAFEASELFASAAR